MMLAARENLTARPRPRHPGCVLQQRPRAKPKLLDDKITPAQSLCEMDDDSFKTLPFEQVLVRIDPKQNEPRYSHLRAEDKFSEAFVFGEKQSALGFGLS